MTSSQRQPGWPAWADAAAVAAAFAALAAWTWGAWPDVLMDFGRELYVAWRTSQGDVLYRDVASFYGPLSPYVNAAWFRLFGVGLRTLALANMAVLAAATAAMWAIVRSGAARGRWGATCGALVFLSLSGFAQLSNRASFNFVCPYSHEATHGFALAAAGVVSSLRLLAGGRRYWAALAGAASGLAFLTKPESFLAAAGASGVAVLLALLRPGARLEPLRVGAAFVGAALLPPAIAFLLLTAALPAGEAWAGVLGSWAFAADPEVRHLPYFAWSMGTQDVPASLRALVAASARQLAVLAPAAGLAWLAGRRPRLCRPLAAAAALAVLIVLGSSWRSGEWFQAARPLPLWAAGALGASAWTLWRSRGDEEAFVRHGARLTLAAFALLLLPRILLNARLYHYGFVLAAPALLLLVAVLLDWVPAALDRRGGGGTVFRSAAVAALAVAVAFHLGVSGSRLRDQRHVLGEGADRFRADHRAPYVSAALEGLRGVERAAGGTLAVLPEGVMINYLLRTRTSIPYLTMLPSDVATFGEDRLLASLQHRPPSVILLVHRDSSEHGARFFGRDYAERIAAWIDERYVAVGHAGDPPFRPGSSFGVVALRLRRPPD